MYFQRATDMMMKNLVLILTTVTIFLNCNIVSAKDRVYHLEVQDITANFTGKDVKHALAIKQLLPTVKKASIPAPILKFRVGETAVIHVTNSSNEPTTLHWHGLLLPWNMDGPAFSNNLPINSGETKTFKFLIRQSGTYWYHSHTELQEQRGLYGAIVIAEEEKRFEVDKEIVMVMSDWINEKPLKVLDRLKGSSYYENDCAIKKSFDTSLWAAIKHGAVWNYLKGEWNRMGPMDLSDVCYDAFLINGKQKLDDAEIKQGETVKLRVINASASTYFYVNIGNNSKFKVIAKDGQNVVPVEVSELLVGMAETYDIIFTLPKMKGMKHRYEVRATAQDISGHASLFLSKGMEENVPDKMKVNPFGGMDHDMGDMGNGGGHHDGHDKGNMGNGGGDHDGHDMGTMKMPPMPMPKRLKYSMLKSIKDTSFDAEYIRNDITLELNGDMERYTWNINGKPFTKDKYIIIRENEVVRFKFVNKTMMHHPMHLHGHFFRVINGQGDRSPLFHTVDVAPMTTVQIEFLANEPGIWLLHCHNLFHMKMGMARLVKYENFVRPEYLVKAEKEWGNKSTKDSDFFVDSEVRAFSNHSDISININKNNYQISLMAEMDNYDPDTFNAEAEFKKMIGKYLAVAGGVEYEDKELFGILSLAYNLPLNLETTVSIRSDGKVMISFEKEIAITDRLVLSLEPEISYLDNEFEYEVETSLMFLVHRNVKVGVFQKYSNEEGNSIGIGISIAY